MGNTLTSNSENDGAEDADADEGNKQTATINSGTCVVSSTHATNDCNAKFLLGNLENLPASAQKLFSMGKLYLQTGKCEDDAGYTALFQTFPSENTGEQERSPSLDPAPSSVNHSKSIQDTLISGAQKISNLFTPLHPSSLQQPSQSYVQWRAGHDLLNMYSMCLPMRNVLYLQPIDDFPEFTKSFVFHANSMSLSFLEMIQGFAQIFFSGMEVVIRPPVYVSHMNWNIRSRSHNVTKQKQYCVTDLYPCLQRIKPRDGRCIMGLSWTDLFPEGYNFVLGEASSEHQVAVVSFGRFETAGFDAETHSDISSIDGKLIWKLIKTLSHEVCHVFGFTHCTFFLCAMNESQSVSQAMTQPLFLCPVCLRKLQKVCGFDIVDRYQLLRKFLAMIHQQTGDCSQIQEAVSWLDSCISYLTTS